MPHFKVHLLTPEGSKTTTEVNAATAEDIRLAVRKSLPGHLIQKVKLVRDGGANG